MAPFLSINQFEGGNSPSSSSSSTVSTVSAASQQYYLTYTLFRAFLFRYLERFFCVDDSSFLFKAFRLFRLLLLYFDPQLANHLDELEFSPEFYSPQWFLTLYARALPLNQVLRLWDMMIAVDDPSFTFYIGLCLLRRQRSALLLGDQGNIPELIAKIHFQNEDEIDEVLRDALELYRNTPRCILRSLRLCCVSTTELTPLPHLTGKSFSSHLHRMRLNVEEYDHQLSTQTVRQSMVITAQELVDSLLPSSPHLRHAHMKGGEENSGDTAVAMSNYVAQQYVVIDVRSSEESIASGGGILPRAMQLEPEFLDNPDAFDVWVQHFDGTRGCNICIIDLPPPQWTGIALWRRLLLGEGDGMRVRSDFDNMDQNRRRLEALVGGRRSLQSFVNPLQSQHRDVDSKHAKEEEQVMYADLSRPAIMLAMALQAHSFPNVSVLDGGFPALVDQLLSTKGTVEPVVINHDTNQWEKFLQSTGRLNEGTKSKKGQKMTDVNNPETPGKLSRKEKDLTELERLEMAAVVAERLQHTSTLEILKEKIQSLTSGLYDTKVVDNNSGK